MNQESFKKGWASAKALYKVWQELTHDGKDIPEGWGQSFDEWTQPWLERSQDFDWRAGFIAGRVSAQGAGEDDLDAE